MQEISNHRTSGERERERERERQPVDIIQLMDRNYIIIPEPCDGYSDWTGKIVLLIVRSFQSGSTTLPPIVLREFQFTVHRISLDQQMFGRRLMRRETHFKIGG